MLEGNPLAPADRNGFSLTCSKGLQYLIGKRNSTYDCDSSSTARDSCTLFAKSKATSKKPRSQRPTIKQLLEKRKSMTSVPIVVTVAGPDNTQVEHTMNVIQHVAGGDVLRVEYTAENMAVVVQILREYGFDERRRQIKNVIDLPDGVGAGIHRRKNKFIVKKRTRNGKPKYTTCISLDDAIQQSAMEASTSEDDGHADQSTDVSIGVNGTTSSTHDTPPEDDHGVFEVSLG